jgi:hypothetical protein
LGSRLIENITCAGYKTVWTLGEVSKAKAAVLQVSFTRLPNVDAEHDGPLIVCVAGLGELRIPFVELGASESLR